MTGLAAASVSGAPIFEQSDGPGGICRSYYVRPGSGEVLDRDPPGHDAYRFEVGGGHWIFGGDPATIGRLSGLADLRAYRRNAVVRLAALEVTVPYPLQAHVASLGPRWARAVEADSTGRSNGGDGAKTLRDWLSMTFGPTLCDLFFFPFHDLYTAGLTDAISPQDDYKSPGAGAPGYNSTFRYPAGGLDALAAQLAGRCDIRYGKRVVAIDPVHQVLGFADGSDWGYDHLTSTLPLHRAVALAGVDLDEEPDPHTSVLVLNIGAERGRACPEAHWQYESDSRCGFHRIGFYSNVDRDFLPASRRQGSHVSMYVERAFVGGTRPDSAVVERYADSVIAELQARGYIGAVDAVHPSWVDTAYTWRSPGSRWRERALQALDATGVRQVGRYGRWQFQGIADSVREGFEAGAPPG